MTTPVPIDLTRPSGPRSQKGAQTRARLVDAAKVTFEETGFLDARVSDIAQRAGLSHGSFYHYFESKEEIFHEVAEAVEARLSAPLESVILDPLSDATPVERIREAIRRHMESYRQEAQIMGVIEAVSRSDAHMNAVRMRRHERYNKQVASSIRRLQTHGLVDSRLDPRIAAAVLGAMTGRFPEMWFVQGYLDCRFDEGVEQLAMVFINGLGLEDGPPSRNRRLRKV